MSGWFPYRWTWSTVLPNLDWAAYCVRRGVANMRHWLPAVWWDDDCDFAPLLAVMRHKLTRMADTIEAEERHVGWKKDVRRLRTCAALCLRIERDDYFFTHKTWKDAEKIANQDTEMLGRLLGKHVRSWWT